MPSLVVQSLRPQGLKPPFLVEPYGTAKAVPSRKIIPQGLNP